MTFRSLDMAHYQLIIPREGAWDTINQLGQIQLAHIVDSGDPLNRPFFNQLKRCDDALQKISFLTNALKDAEMEIAEFDETQDQFFENLQQVWKEEAKMHGIQQIKLIDKFEGQVMEEWTRYQEISMSIEKFKQSKKLILEKLASIEAVESIYQAKEEQIEVNMIEGRMKGFCFMVGVVAQQSQSRLTRMIYRVSMGYAFVKTIQQFKYKELMNFKQKVVVVIYPNSDAAVLERKIKRVMESFCANNFIISQDQINVQSEKGQLLSDYEEFTNLLTLNQNQMKSFFQRIKSVYNLQNWRIYFWKERHLYSILDKTEVRQQFFRVNIYVPKEQAAKLSLRLNKLVPSPVLHEVVLSKPPTAFRVTEYTAIAQQITNTYGIPRYQQVNPTVFTVITFPFFFGVMFGDIAHGGILLAFGLFLIFKEQAVKKSKIKVFASLKYMITMMGFFSFYCGWIYNDFIGMNINVFGSCFNPPHKYQSSGDDKQTMTSKAFYPTSPDCVYPFGVDPIWGRATNQLVYINALKMKISVIIAIIHMSLGVAVKAFNSVYFKKRLDFYFQFIPQFIFLVLLFGYMDFLIVFKWFKQGEWMGNSYKAPSIISTMMNIGLKVGQTSEKYDGSSNMWGEIGNTSQDTIQLFILIIAFLCIPIMLLPKPIIQINKIKKHKAQNPLQALPSMEQFEQEMEIEKKLINKSNQELVEEEKHQQPSEIFVHQLIQTIQFVLGAVSNTASYLRLWALSLAHSQLAKVFFEKLLVNGYEMTAILAIPTLLYGFYFLCWITFGVLMCMDTMQCFLHSLRLHWVEFQNKFYKGDGYKYQPFSFRNIILENKSKSD